MNIGLTAPATTPAMTTVTPPPVLQPQSRRFSALLALLLLGAGGTAFAVASLAPGADRIAVQQVIESVRPLGLADVVLSVEQPGFRLFRTETVRSSDTIDALLARLGVDDPVAADFLRSDARSRSALFGETGRSVTAETSQAQALVRLTVRWVDGDDERSFRRLVVERRDAKAGSAAAAPSAAASFDSSIETAPLVATTRLASANIRSSLLAATDDAGVPDSVATQIVDIFDDIDFHSDLRRGDRFRVVYEMLEADGEPMRAGRVLSVDFSTRGQTRQAIWFQPPGIDAATGKAYAGGYYTPTGRSLHHTYLASPMEFSRVTSGFQMREHPISKAWKQHLGVDYGAPAGTPVRSVGDGVVQFAGVQSGYGNVVIIEHRNDQTTLYAHLSKIGVKTGKAVAQGEYIGRVGSTGWATGPHLHFEFRINGVHHDPLTIAQQTDTVPLTKEATTAFLRIAAMMRLQLAAAESVQQASAE